MNRTKIKSCLKVVKGALKKIFCPPTLAVVCISVPSLVFVFIILATSNRSAAAYAAYILSAYALAISVVCVVRHARQFRRKKLSFPIIQKIRGIPVGDRILSDDEFRSEIVMYAGLCINILYSAMNFYLGARYESVWYVMLSFYYILLSVMRGLAASRLRKNQHGLDMKSQLRSYRGCGITLLVMNQVLTGIVIYIVNNGQSFEYSGNLIYAMAAYTFYITINAVVNVIKYRKRGSPTMSAAKMISLTAALVSMLSLETAMLSRFGSDDDHDFRAVMTSVSGGAVCVIVLAMAVYMIAWSTSQLKKQAKNQL